MENVLFCPNCGAKTLEDQNDWDYEAGDNYLCKTCNTEYWMSCAGVKAPTAEEDPKEEYKPIIGFNDYMSARLLA